ncbi:unknown [Clostridium sp. CAG:921]|nr:unknown [Clostridium sp. CAG:921]
MGYNDEYYNDDNYDEVYGDEQQDIQNQAYQQQQNSGDDARAKNPANLLLQTTKAFAKGAKRAVKVAVKAVLFFIRHPILLIGALGIAGAGAIFLSIGELTSDGVLDLTDQTVNNSKNSVQDDNKLMNTYKLLSVGNFNKVLNLVGTSNVINATTAQNTTTTTDSTSSSTDNSANSKKKKSGSISDEAKEEYNKKGSLLLMTLDDIEKIYSDYITSKTTTSTELNFMMYKVGEYDPGTHDDEILKYGTINGSNTISESGGSYSNSDLIINGQFNAFNTRDPNNVKNPNSLQLTDTQINTFREYYESINLPDGRKNMIMNALSLIGKCYYSQKRRQMFADVPVYLDCSSYTLWSYHKGGGTASVGECTSEMVNRMQVISKEEMIPGDVMFQSRIW